MERAGIPTVLIEFADQVAMTKQTALTNGCPNIRFVDSPRVGTGPQRVDAFYANLIKALTDPLTAKEKESGLYEPPPSPRIVFTGSLLDAQDFYESKSELMATGARVLDWTDGLPIIIPTETAVKLMLTGTSHSKDEKIYRYTMNTTTKSIVKSSTPVSFSPMAWTATVEKVAVNAVMAGCKPEYLPVVLAISSSGVSTGTTTFWGEWECISGPIAKEIGLNAGIGGIDPGNKANATIGRTFQLMAANLGGAVVGVNRMTSIGNPLNLGGTCFAENVEGLPEGWIGLNEDYGYKKDQSIAYVNIANMRGGITGAQFAPSSYRGLQGSGTGGMATRLGVEGKPGPHNWLAYLVPGLWANNCTPINFIMIPELAQDLKNYGFGSKQAVKDWVWKSSFIPIKQYKTYGWYDFYTNSGNKIEPTSGKSYKSLPDDYMTPAVGDTPSNSIQIFVSGGAEEVCLQITGLSLGTPYPIDPWK